MHSASRHLTSFPGVHAISITSDRSFPRHSHDEFGFGLMLSRGHDTWSGRGAVEAVAGDVITVNPAELHDGLGRSGAPRGWRMIFLSPDALGELIDADAGRFEFQLPVLHRPSHASLVAAAIETAACSDAPPTELEQALMLALGPLLAEPNGSKPSHMPQAVGLIVEQIHAEWDAPLVLDDFAETAGLSRFQTLRAFSQQMGITPHAYLVQLRLNRARGLMLQGVSLAEAAIATGFTDQAHMTRAFARQFGLSPGRYLKAGGVQ